MSSSGRVYVQHLGHLLWVAGRTRITISSSEPRGKRQGVSSREVEEILPIIGIESEYVHSGDEVPNDPSSTNDASDTMKRVLRKDSTLGHDKRRKEIPTVKAADLRALKVRRAARPPRCHLVQEYRLRLLMSFLIF